MASPDDELEARLRKLEDEVVRLREDVAVCRADVAAARVLAGGADREVSDVRVQLAAHTQALNVLHETQLEQGQQTASLRRELRVELHAEVSVLRSEMERGFGVLNNGIAQITALLRGRKEPEGG